MLKVPMKKLPGTVLRWVKLEMLEDSLELAIQWQSFALPSRPSNRTLLPIPIR